MKSFEKINKKASINILNEKSLIRELIFYNGGIFPFYKPRNAILDVFFSPEQTKFDVNLLIIRTIKSLRTQRRLFSREKKILQYRMAGKCFRYRKAGLCTTYTVRNALSLIAFECNFAFFSRFLVSFEIQNNFGDIENEAKNFSYKKSTLHYLRKKSAMYSIYIFDFVTELTKEEEIKKKKNDVFHAEEDRDALKASEDEDDDDDDDEDNDEDDDDDNDEDGDDEDEDEEIKNMQGASEEEEDG